MRRGERGIAGVTAVLAALGCGSDGVGLGGGPTGTTSGSTPELTSDGLLDEDDRSEDDGPDPDDAPDPDGDTGACGGCVDAAGACLPGDLDDACGAMGAECTVCSNGRQCAEGECVTPPACDVDSCEGCCDGDACIARPNDQACGAGGLQCTVCPEGSVCEDGACALPCEATCDGCCAPSGKCIGADEQSADGCGMGADVCVVCDVGLDCVDGSCVSATCANTCDGCCDGSECLDGDTPSQCGMDGAGCIACGAGTTCEPEGCVPDPMAQWDLTVLDGEVSLEDPMGAAWDAFNGLPDPYVTIDIVGASAQSDFAADTIFPVWNEVIAEGVTTVQLMDEHTFTVYDDDVAVDDVIGQCTATIPTALFGSFYDLDCEIDGYEAWSLSFQITPSL